MNSIDHAPGPVAGPGALVPVHAWAMDEARGVGPDIDDLGEDHAKSNGAFAGWSSMRAMSHYPNDSLIPVTTLSSLWSFVLVVGLLTMTPGMDTALILRTAALGAPRRAWGVVFGIQSGTLSWGVLTSAGVTALFTASHLAYEALRWAGACYLIWMGLSMLWATRHRRSRRSIQSDEEPAAVSNDFFPGWRRGALTNLLNPKMGAFYVALLPQFIPSGAPTFIFGALLACVHIILGTAWSASLVVLAHRLRNLLQRPAARQVLDRVAGTVITGFGIRLATSNH